MKMKKYCNKNYKPLKKKCKTTEDRKNSNAHGLAESLL
jgi:hypothetical protein